MKRPKDMSFEELHNLPEQMDFVERIGRDGLPVRVPVRREAVASHINSDDLVAYYDPIDEQSYSFCQDEDGNWFKQPMHL